MITDEDRFGTPIEFEDILPGDTVFKVYTSQGVDRFVRLTVGEVGRSSLRSTEGALVNVKRKAQNGYPKDDIYLEHRPEVTLASRDGLYVLVTVKPTVAHSPYLPSVGFVVAEHENVLVFNPHAEDVLIVPFTSIVSWHDLSITPDGPERIQA